MIFPQASTIKPFTNVIDCKIFEPFYFRIQQLGSTPFKVAALAPKLADPLWTAPPLLFLDPVFLIWIDYHFVLYTCLLYEIHYLETRSHCVNMSFMIIPNSFKLVSLSLSDSSTLV
jgi:hypothetical protein